MNCWNAVNGLFKRGFEVREVATVTVMGFFLYQCLKYGGTSTHLGSDEQRVGSDKN